MPTNIHLNDTDEAIKNEIKENGRATVSLLAKIIPKSEQYIRERVRRMREHGILIEIAPRLYDIADRKPQYEDHGIEIETPYQ